MPNLKKAELMRLATTALLAGDLARALAELRKGLDSDERKAFVQRLAALTRAEVETHSIAVRYRER